MLNFRLKVKRNRLTSFLVAASETKHYSLNANQEKSKEENWLNSPESSPMLRVSYSGEILVSIRLGNSANDE